MNPSGILCIPHYKSLRSLEGARKAKYVLAAFYKQEPSVRHILPKVLFDKTSILIPVLKGIFIVPRRETTGQHARNSPEQQLSSTVQDSQQTTQRSPNRRLNRTRRRVSDESDSDNNILVTPSPPREVQPSDPSSNVPATDTPSQPS